MKFYGRTEELKQLKKISETSKDHSQFTVVTGRRRIGKTALILKSAEGQRSVYLFVSRVNQRLLCQGFQSILDREGIETAGEMTRFADILKALMIHSRSENITVIIDEFQDLEYVDKSVFSEIQDVWDRYKDGSRVNLIVCGSVHSMMMRIFENSKEPLFGRPTAKIVLQPLPVSVMEGVLADHNPDYTAGDMLTFFMLTGGIPKYMEVLMDGGATDSESMLRAAVSAGSVFLADGKDIMVSEFGKEYRTYFSIMQLISAGKTKRSEMEDILNIEIGQYLKMLEEEYGFVKHISPAFSDSNSRNTRWVISDMYLRFYFRFIFPSSSLVESGRHDLLLRTIRPSLETYEGKVLESFFRRRIAEEDSYTYIGSYWNRKGDIEIDIVVIDDIAKTMRFIEVKRNPAKLDINELVEKVKSLASHTDGYAVSNEGLTLDDVRRP